jgi:hypothetical protein
MRGRGLIPSAVLLIGLAGAPACTDTDLVLTTETYTVGTFDLAPAGGSGSESESISAMVPRPAGDLVVKEMRFFVADASGRELNLDDDLVHLHHVVMMSSKTADGSCPTSGYPAIGGQRFAASGNEKTPIVLPAGYGYHVGAGDTWRALWHLMNMGPTRRTGVRLAYEISYVRGTPSVPQRDVTPYYLDVAGCEHADFDLPGGGAVGTTAAKTATFTLPRAGRAVYTLGHLHDGGVDVTLRAPAGQVWCTATASYTSGAGHEHSMPMPMPAATGHISAISACPLPFDIHAAEAWSVSARYPADVPFNDVMGVIFTFVAE